MEDNELVTSAKVIKWNEGYASEASLSAPRASWEQAKKEGRLTGCGLMGNLTMDDIEDLQEQVDSAMTVWSKLAGTQKVEKKVEEDIYKIIQKLAEDVCRLGREMSDLRRSVEVQKIKEKVAEVPKKDVTDVIDRIEQFYNK